MAVVVTSSSSVTPGPRSLGQLKTEIASLFGAKNSGEVLALAEAGIQRGVRRLNTRCWNSLIVSQSITLAADDVDYTINDNYKDSFHGEFLDSNSKANRGISWEDPKTFMRHYPVRNQSGTPRLFTVIGQLQDSLLQFDRPPDSAFVTSYPTFRHWYYRRVQDATQDSDEILLPSELESLIVLYGEWHVQRRIDPRAARETRQDIFALWQQLVADDTDLGMRNWDER